MAWFTDLLQLVVAVLALLEFRRMRAAVEAGQGPVATPPVDPGPGVQDDAATALPAVLDDATELALEREKYDTMGARSGYMVTPYWVEQDEREAFDEQCSKD